MRNLIALTALFVASPAFADTYAEYSGPNAIIEGQGGTKISKHGIDFWTSGAPYGRFQILGVYTDERSDRLIAGDAIGSKSIAKKVLKLGGNGVIVLDRNSQYGGSNVRVNDFGAGPFARSRAYNLVTAELVVVRYLAPNQQP
jgi:hypothetical protein